MPVDGKLARLVRERAQERCEYCHLPRCVTSLPFEIDHIIAEKHRGKTALNNLAWSCLADNRCKRPNISGIDPKTRKKTWLYNPRRQKWDRHFRWDGPVLIGRTAIGRVTVAVLHMNAPHRVAQRAALIEERIFHTS